MVVNSLLQCGSSFSNERWPTARAMLIFGARASSLVKSSLRASTARDAHVYRAPELLTCALFLMVSVVNCREAKGGMEFEADARAQARASARAEQMSSVRSTCVRPCGAAASSGRSGPDGSRRRWPPGCSACCAPRTWTPPTRCPRPPRRRPSGSTRDSCNQHKCAQIYEYALSFCPSKGHNYISLENK